MSLSDSRVCRTTPPQQAFLSYANGIFSSWEVVHTNPEAAETGDAVNGSSKVVRPSSLTNSAIHPLVTQGIGTTLLVALRYNASASGFTAPVVRVFGRSQPNSESELIWHVLRDINGNDEHTLSISTNTDVVDEDGTLKTTEPIEVDLDGCDYIIVAVQTAFNASSGTENDSEIIAKVK